MWMSRLGEQQIYFNHSDLKKQTLDWSSLQQLSEKLSKVSP